MKIYAKLENKLSLTDKNEKQLKIVEVLKMNQKFSFEIVEELAVLSENTKGWRKELNLVRWNENPPKFDIREWSPDHEKMGKGLTFTNEEMDVLKQFLKA